jgi:hypothetical protein
MASQEKIFLVVEWLERGTMGVNGDRIQYSGRKVSTVDDFPRILPCHNPECEGGGFEIGRKISSLLRSGQYNEQNSLVCINAIGKRNSKRCLHTIFYSIARVLPYQREIPKIAAARPEAG